MTALSAHTHLTKNSVVQWSVLEHIFEVIEAQ